MFDRSSNQPPLGTNRLSPSGLSRLLAGVGTVDCFSPLYQHPDWSL